MSFAQNEQGRRRERPSFTSRDSSTGAPLLANGRDRYHKPRQIRAQRRTALR